MSPLFRATGAGGGISAIDLLVNGTLIGSRAKLNLINGAGAIITGVDNSGAARVDATIGVATGGYTAAVLADSPAVYLRVGELAGTNAVDSSGNARDATYSGGYTLGATGAITDGNKAVTLNGTTGYIDAGATNGLILGQNDWTFECWINTASLAGAQQIFGGDATGATKMWGIKLGTDGKLRGTIMNQGDNLAASSAAVVAGTYAHTMCVYTQANQTLTYYLNGSGAGSGAFTSGDVATVSTTARQRAIGADYVQTTGTHFNGTIDEIAIYTTALAGTRASAHYNAR